MTRIEAEEIVRAAYLRVLGRDPFPPTYDAGAYDYVIGLGNGELTPAEVESDLRVDVEAHVRANAVVRRLYLEVLGRDPGPPAEGEPWADPEAVAYAYDFRRGVKNSEKIRSELEASPEAKVGQGRATIPEVLDNVLHDTGTGRKDLELGISLFYAMSPETTDAQFSEVVSELAAARIRQVRLAGSTFTWDNAPKKANVIPFRRGSAYVHREKGSVDEGVGVDPVVDPAHLSKLSKRLRLLTSRGIRAQYTIFWGGMQPLFTRQGAEVLWGRTGPYLLDIARFFREHPEHTIEIINEADHGHHLARLGQDGRAAFLDEAARIVRSQHPKAVITASDGGRQPAEEGDPYFAYHAVAGLNYWNVHYPRDPIMSSGIPRWSRGSFHLYGEKGEWMQAHGKGGYGRSDENIFLTTEEEFQTWQYRGSTRDWQMYGTMLWVTTAAGAGLTLHTFKGFFCQPGLTTDPIFRVVKAWNEILRDFPFHGASTFNTGWNGSPVKSFDGPFKAFALTSGENGRDVLVVVLNPAGRIVFDMDRPRTGTFYEITGEPRLAVSLKEGETSVALGKPAYEHALVLRLNG